METGENALSNDGLTLVKRHIILPYVIATLEHDKKVLTQIGVKVPKVYCGVLDKQLESAFAEVTETRKELRKMGVKVSEVARGKKGGIWEYYFHGYKKEFTMLWEFVRAEVEQYLGLKLSVYNVGKAETHGK